MQHKVKMSGARPPVDPVLGEIAAHCLLMRSRLVARVVTAEYDAALQPFGIGAAQFALLTVIGNLQPASRAAIGRFHRQDRSTLTRNLRLVLEQGWAEEVGAAGRARPVRLTERGMALLHRAAPTWRAAQARIGAMLGAEDAASLGRIADKLLAGP